MTVLRMTLLSALALALTAGGAAAQACIGMPTRDGDIALLGVYQHGEVHSSVGGEFHVDVSGPTAFSVGYRTGTGDSELDTFEGQLALQLDLVEPEMCLVTGLRYDDISGPFDGGPLVTERLAVPVGLGIGKALYTAVGQVSAYAIPQYVWAREEVRLVADGPSDTETSHEFAGELGLTLGLTPALLSAALVVGTLDDSPAFRVGVGVTF